jgi:DMSO/TMAO reductase YedYZ molybdopterin-dependent catalytic subunit
MAMKERREFLKTLLVVMSAAGFFLASPVSFFVRSLRGAERMTILPKGTKRESLINKNPQDLDTRNLELTPLKQFETMGETDFKVDLKKWRLEVTGRVKNPLSLTYSEVLALPSTEKAVLLICPGFFANYGRWKGIQMEALLKKAGAEKTTYITFGFTGGSYERKEQFFLQEVLSGAVFLAYGVNGETLPEKHGFPLRGVAQGHYGSRWIKYVDKVIVG